MPNPEPLSHNEQYQSAIGELSAELRAARALLYETCSVKDSGDGMANQNIIKAVMQSKYISCEICAKVAQHAMRLVGGRSILRRYPFERFYREGIVGVVMPPSNSRCIEVASQTSFTSVPSDFYFTSGFLAGKETAAEAIMTAVIPKESEGTEVKEVWDAMGMRGTASDNIIFENTFSLVKTCWAGKTSSPRSGRSTLRCSTWGSPRRIWDWRKGFTGTLSIT